MIRRLILASTTLLLLAGCVAGPYGGDGYRRGGYDHESYDNHNNRPYEGEYRRNGTEYRHVP